MVYATVQNIRLYNMQEKGQSHSLTKNVEFVDNIKF